MFLHSSGGEVFDAVHTITELALHAQHFHGAEVFFEHLAFGVEEAYLLAHEASHDKTGFHTGEAASLDDESAVAQDGLFQCRPLGAVHPRNHVATLLLRYAVEHLGDVSCQIVEVLILIHVQLGSGNHTVDNQRVIAMLRGSEDESCIDGIVARQCCQLSVADGPCVIDFFLCHVGMLQVLDFRH